MAGIDRVVLLAIALSAPALAWLLRQQGARGRRFAAALAAGFYGLVLVLTMAAHCVDVASRLHLGRGYDGAVMRYGFRVYSLFLLAAVLVACGVTLLHAAVALARRRAGARGRALAANLVALAVVAPLVPIQPLFAIVLSALGLLLLATLLWVAPRPVVPLPVPVPRAERREAVEVNG